MFRFDPGPCPVCGAPHTTCTATTGPIVIDQLPARPPLVAEIVQATLPADQFTTGTYRRPKKGV